MRTFLNFNPVLLRSEKHSVQKMKYSLVLLLLCIFYQNVCAYKFLAILATSSKSHYYIGHNLMKGLAADGHEVVVVSPFQEKNPIKNYKEVYLENNWEESRKCNLLNFFFLQSAIISKPFILDMAKNKFVGHNSITLTWEYLNLANEMANWTLSSQNLRDFIKTEQHFDAIIVEMCLTDALLGFGQHFNAPLIGLSAFGASKWTTVN